MRRSALVHRFLPEGTPAPGTDRSAYQDLLDAGFVVALGPGLVAGTPLLERVIARIEDALLLAAEGLGVQRASLPACEGEALVNLLAHLGWAGARTGLAALGTGFREMTTEPEGLHGLALYRRLDIVRLQAAGAAADPSAESAASAAGDLLPAILSTLAGLGVPEPTRDEQGVLRAGGHELGRAIERPLASPGAEEGAAPVDALLLLDLDLFAVLSVVAAHHRDERGLKWPDACAPYDVALVEAAGDDPAARETSVKLEAELGATGFAALRDDTGEQAATQRRAAERLGIPYRVLCGPTCAQGVVVLESRAGGTPERVPVAEVIAWLERRMGSRTGTARARRMHALY
jgi:hypothetical protein